jgi:hypothetical protein
VKKAALRGASGVKGICQGWHYVGREEFELPGEVWNASMRRPDQLSTKPGSTSPSAT